MDIDAFVRDGARGALESIPARRSESWNIRIVGKEVFVIPKPVEEFGESSMRLVSEPTLLGLTVEQASRYPSFSFERGARVHDWIRDENGCVVGAELEARNGAREVRADLVLGCDGHGSLIRERAGLELELLPEQYDVLWFKVPAPERLQEGCSIMTAAAEEHPAICHTSWDGRPQYGLVKMPKGGLKDVRKKDWGSIRCGRRLRGWPSA